MVRNSLTNNGHSSPMHYFSHILARTHRNLLYWKSKSLGALDRDCIATENHIKSLEDDDWVNPNRLSSLIELDSLYNRHKVLSREINTRCAQRAKLNWISKGNVNSSCFHGTVKIHRHHNAIFHISDEQGNEYTKRVY